MTYKEKLRITRLLGVGVPLKDIHIGWMGYANGWYPPFGDGSWMCGGLERFIVQKCKELKSRAINTSHPGEQILGYNNYVFNEYNVSYDVDSSG